MKSYKIIQSMIACSKSFESSAKEIWEYILGINLEDYLDILSQIGAIPESVPHDSTSEKIYSKVSDMILARGFRELGLKSRVLTERGDAADVYAESYYHDYSLVGDAKIFRLSRTAKNQKDFKVSGLNSWRNDNDYAVLCSPYFLYPKKRSQVYSESLSLNVSLFSWEWLLFLIKNGIHETPNFSLEKIWNFSKYYTKKVTIDKIKNRYLEQEEKFMQDLVLNSNKSLKFSLKDIYIQQVALISDRSEIEKKYWKNEISNIKKYSRSQAIEELLKLSKIDNKINYINNYVKGIQHEFGN